MHQQQTAFENIVGKGEIARYEQFLLFPQCFLLNQILESPFVHNFDILSLFAAESEEPKIGISVKWLTQLCPLLTSNFHWKLRNHSKNLYVIALVFQVYDAGLAFQVCQVQIVGDDTEDSESEIELKWKVVVKSEEGIKCDDKQQ